MGNDILYLIRTELNFFIEDILSLCITKIYFLVVIKKERYLSCFLVSQYAVVNVHLDSADLLQARKPYIVSYVKTFVNAFL